MSSVQQFKPVFLEMGVSIYRILQLRKKEENRKNSAQQRPVSAGVDRVSSLLYLPSQAIVQETRESALPEMGAKAT